MNSLRNAVSVMSKAMNRGHIIMPAALGTLAQMSLQDFRIGKIVGGIGLTVSGANLVVTSGILKTLKSWSWTDNQAKESPSKTALRWGTAVAGIMITGYGIYNIATGILELTAPTNTQLHKAYDSKFSNNIDSSNTCDEAILKAKEQLLSCPEGQKLWNEVESKGAFTIRCATSREAPAGAMVWAEKREILLSETNKEMVTPLVFELNNLKRAEMASLIGKYQCSLGVDEYATATEAIEYGTVEDTYKISDRCIKDGFWPSDLNKYQEEFSGKSTDVDWTTFKGYLETQEKYGHTDLYRMNWYEKCNPQGLSKWFASNMDKWRAVLAESQTKDEI